jgi:hypothetical protein
MEPPVPPPAFSCTVSERNPTTRTDALQPSIAECWITAFEMESLENPAKPQMHRRKVDVQWDGNNFDRYKLVAKGPA